MGFETTGGGEMKSGDYAPQKFVRWMEHEDPKPNHYVCKKGSHVIGHYLKTFERDYNGKTQVNHTIIDKDGTHLVIPHAGDIIKAFADPRTEVGCLTKLTYLGKEAFEGTDDKGKKVAAKAVRVLLEQDKEDKVSFEGSPGCETITKLGEGMPTQVAPAAATITTSEVPF